MTEYLHTLTDKERQVLSILDAPTTTAEIAELLGGISTSTVRDHLSAIRSAGVPLGEKYNSDGAKEFYRTVDTQLALDAARPTLTTSKAAHTKAKKDVLKEVTDWLADDLTGRSAVVADGGLSVEPSREDMVVHRSDDHIGAYYEDEYNNVIYDEKIAAERVREINDRTFDLKHRQEQSGIEFDTLHILLGGDGVHGEGIHEDQPWESALTLIEQIELYTDLYMEFIDRATREFESVQVVCQRGNHGELRGDGMSPDANADDAAFMILEKRCGDRGYDNLTIRAPEGSFYTNFPIRGNDLATATHRGHLRHGQNSLFHVGTSSGENRWRGWFAKHQPDIAYRGHYHTFRYESLDNTPIIMSGAICPPSDYEESFASWSEPAATVHGVSDERVVTWFYPVFFNG
jgi:DNA-binding Lrp family transcriptional regulator